MNIASRFAGGFLIVTASVSAAVLLHVIYAFDLTDSKQFNGPAVALVYHAVPAALVIVCVAAFFAPSAARINTALVLVSGAFALFGLEVLCAFFPGLFVHSRPGGSAEIVHDSRSKLQVIEELRANGIPALPSVNPKTLLRRDPGSHELRSAISLNGIEHLPLSSISSSIAVYCNETGPWLSYGSDEYGFHNPAGLWRGGRVQIAIVGDSFAYGYCVPSDKSFAAAIRGRYPSTVNLGIGGNGPLMELAGIQEYVPIIKPRVVLWFFAEVNDLCDLEIERNIPILMRYLAGSFRQDLHSRHAEVDAALRLFVERVFAQLARERMTGVFTLRALRERMGVTHSTREGWDVRHYRDYGCKQAEGELYPEDFQGRSEDLLRDVLARARESVSAAGGKLYFVYLPGWLRYSSPAAATPHRDPVLAVVRSLAIPLIDVTEAFDSHGDPLALFPFRRQGHYNEEGHRVTAEAVLRAISGAVD